MAKVGKGRQTGGKKTLRRRLILLLILALAAAGCVWYLASYYPADETAIEAFAAEYPVEERVLENGDLVFGTGREEVGLIFYPGGKVDHEAYAPLMRELAAEGVFCVICKVPCHLAIFEENAADGIREDYPAVDRWYLGGHSLGGVMAASYLSGYPADYEGLILLASYSSKDLSNLEDLAVLSICGSEDGVMNRRAYERSRANLPARTAELVIDGGCHAGFGMYGPQRGDGTPTISGEEQIRRTAEAILTLLHREEAR